MSRGRETTFIVVVFDLVILMSLLPVKDALLTKLLIFHQMFVCLLHEIIYFLSLKDCKIMKAEFS